MLGGPTPHVLAPRAGDDSNADGGQHVRAPRGCRWRPTLARKQRQFVRTRKKSRPGGTLSTQLTHQHSRIGAGQHWRAQSAQKHWGQLRPTSARCSARFCPRSAEILRVQDRPLVEMGAECLPSQGLPLCARGPHVLGAVWRHLREVRLPHPCREQQDHQPPGWRRPGPDLPDEGLPRVVGGKYVGMSGVVTGLPATLAYLWRLAQGRFD